MKLLLLSAASDVLGDGLRALALLAVGVVVLAVVATATVLALPLGLVLGRVGNLPPSVPAPAGSVPEIPPDHLRVMVEVGARTGVPWEVLAAMAKVESGFGRNMATSSAGAIGYGQFLPSSWAVYDEGGDPYDYRDAIPAMARYLLDHGAPDNLPGAIWGYNHSDWYVELVLEQARAYGYTGAPATGQDSGQ